MSLQYPASPDFGKRYCKIVLSMEVPLKLRQWKYLEKRRRIRAVIIHPGSALIARTRIRNDSLVDQHINHTIQRGLIWKRDTFWQIQRKCCWGDAGSQIDFHIWDVFPHRFGRLFFFRCWERTRFYRVVGGDQLHWGSRKMARSSKLTSSRNGLPV